MATIGSLALTVNELKQTVEKRFDDFEQRLDDINIRFDHFERQVDHRFDNFERQVDDRFDRFGRQVDERFDEIYDRCGEIDNRFNDIHTRFDNFENQVGIRFDEIDKQIDTSQLQIFGLVDKIQDVDQRYDNMEVILHNGNATSRWSEVFPVAVMTETATGKIFNFPKCFPRKVAQFWHLTAPQHRDWFIELITFYGIFTDVQQPLRPYVAENLEQAHALLAQKVHLNYETIKLQMEMAVQQDEMAGIKRALSSSEPRNTKRVDMGQTEAGPSATKEPTKRNRDPRGLFRGEFEGSIPSLESQVLYTPSSGTPRSIAQRPKTPSLNRSVGSQGQPVTGRVPPRGGVRYGRPRHGATPPQGTPSKAPTSNKSLDQGRQSDVHMPSSDADSEDAEESSVGSESPT